MCEEKPEAQHKYFCMVKSPLSTRVLEDEPYWKRSPEIASRVV